MRREGSIGSISSAGGNVSGRALRRQGSSGSMSDRTFRDQSPGRPPSRGRIDSPPPIPALPKQLPPIPRNAVQTAGQRPATSSGPAPPPIPQRSQRRASSVEPPFARAASSPPRQNTGRGLKVDTNRVASSPGLVAAQRASSIAVAGLPPRPESRGSVNFSYPISPRSPTPSMDERRAGSGAVWGQQSPIRVASPVSSGNTLRSNAAPAVQGGIQQAPKLAKKKKPAVEKGIGGRQSEDGGIGSQAAQNPVKYGGPGAPSNHLEVASPVTRKDKVASPSATLPDRPSSVASYHSDLDTISEDGDAPERPTRFKTRAAALLVKHPSVVRENRELEEKAEAADKAGSPSNTVGLPQVKPIRTAASPKVNSPEYQPAEGRRTNSRDSPIAGNYVKTNQHDRSSSQPAPMLPRSIARRTGSVDMEATTRNTSAGRGRATGRGGRPQSLSPTRYAHFAVTPPTSSPLIVKHEPPPRSLSPAKSAMRKSPSPRPGSAASQNSTTGYAGYGQVKNDPSDTSMISDDGTVGAGGPRKKNARVSFDEESVITGEGRSSPTIPAQSAYRKATAESIANGTPDDILTPTPALPSFGSLRGRRDRDDDKRMSQPSLAPAPLQASSDHAIGALLLGDSKRTDEGTHDPTDNPANVLESSKINQIPSEITPIKRTDDGTDTDGSAYSDDGQGQKDSIVSDVGTPADAQANSYTPLTEVTAKDINSGAAQFDLGGKYDVPSIEFTQPTPSLEQTETVLSWNTQTVASPESLVDGRGDPENESQHKPLNASPALAGLAEPEPEEVARNHSPGTPTLGHFAEDLRHQTDPQSGDNNDDDQSSVYSDAAEDLSRVEGDGFGSIDAVVDTPPVDTRPGIATTTRSDSPSRKLTNRQPDKDSLVVQTNGTDTGSSVQENWSKTKAYWSSVSGRQKQELERAAAPSTSDNVVESIKPQGKKGKKVIPKVQQESQTPSAQSAIITANKLPLPTVPRLKQGQVVPSSNRGYVKTPVSLRSQNINPNTQLPRSMRSGPAQTSIQQLRPATSPAKNTLRPETGDLRAPRRARPESTPDAFSTAVQNELRSMNAPAIPSSKSPVPGKKKGVLRRTKSSDSDSSASSSSFRKKSRPMSSSSGGVSLRRTMRTGSQSDGMDLGNRSSRFSVRSLSPAGSTTRRPFSPSPSTSYTNRGTMKMSLRGAQGSSMPTLRPQSADQAKPPSSFTGFGRMSKPRGKPPRSGGQQRSRRFSDSSDEGMPTSTLPTFRSRFGDDSSDEEERPVERLAPVRGIPRRIGEEDRESSDLPDSSEDERRVVEPSKVTKSKKQETSSGPSTALAIGSLRHSNGSGMDLSKGVDAQRRKEKDKDKPGHKKRRSFFFAALGKRHHQHQKKFETVQDMMTAAAAERRHQMNEEKQQVGDEQQITNGLITSTPPTSPRPKVSKRNSSMAQTQIPDEDSWPTPPAASTQPSSPLKSALITRPEDKRPTTSDGVPSSSRGRSLRGVRKYVHIPHPHLHRHHDHDDPESNAARPDMGRRRVTLRDAPTGVDEMAEDSGVQPGSEKRKKKRFGMLRRAFGLYD